MVPLAHIAGGSTTRHQNGGTPFRRPPFFKTKKLALLGATGNLEYAPWDDPTWTLAAHPCCRPRCLREPDWYFDLHRPECFRTEIKGWNPQYWTWLKTLQTPIFMQEAWPEIPMAVRYPRERIFAEFRAYFSNHCAYLIALAMTEGVTHLGLFGCQYAGGERHVQRDSLTYWLGRFEQAGGTLVIPEPGNSLLSMPLYGYASHDDEGRLLPIYKPTPMTTNPKGQPVVLQPVSAVPLMEPPDWARQGLQEQADAMARSPLRRVSDFAGNPRVERAGATPPSDPPRVADHPADVAHAVLDPFQGVPV